MEKNRNPFEKPSVYKHIRVFFYIILAQSFVAGLWLLLIPKEPANAFFLGYSIRRLILLIPLVLPPCAALLVDFMLQKQKAWRKWFELERNKAKIAILLILSGLISALAIWSFIFLYYFLDLIKDPGIYNRLMPLLIAYILIGIELPAFVVISLFRIPKDHRKIHPIPWRSFFSALIVIGACLLLVAVTGWGQGATRIIIVSLGVPVLEGQIWFIAGILLLVPFAALTWNAIPGEYRRHSIKHMDMVVFAVLWLIAVVLWVSLPLPSHNYFAPSVRAPTFEKYPFSDAEQYDYNSLYVLYGTTENFVISKPLYVSFLAVLHALVGLDYGRVIFLQTLVIAVFPGILYLIGKELHSRLGGVTVALLVIFRELNSIQASTMANVSNSKLLLSDMLAAILISLLVYTIIRWYKYPGKKISIHAFFVGGIIGALILTRIQAMVLVPFGILLVIVRYYKNKKTTLISILLMVIAVGLVLTPILIRNHAITGVYWVDNPSSSQGLYRYFVLEDDYGIEIPEASSMDEQLNRNISVISNAFAHGFGTIMQFVMDHFMRNEISSMLILPVRLGNQPQFLDFLKITQPFWAETYSQFNLLNVIVLVINAAIIALGFAYAFKRNPWAALCIIGLHLTYSLSSAIVRIAGWRFILPVDWIILIFYALGLTELSGAFFQAIFGWDIKTQAAHWAAYPVKSPAKLITWQGFLFPGLLMILTGGFIPIRESFLPSTAPEYERSEICNAFISAAKSSQTPEYTDAVAAYCEDAGTSALMGFGVYPRLFLPGEGYYERLDDHRFGIQDYSRLVFRIIGKSNSAVFIKTNAKDIKFPNGALVYVLAQDITDNGADYVLIAGEEPELIISTTKLNPHLLLNNQ